MQIFNSFQEFEQYSPEAASMVLNENKLQYPNATFVKGAAGYYYWSEVEDGPEDEDAVVLFDVGQSGLLLYIWIGSADNAEDAFIDEYDLHDAKWAIEEVDQVK
jgi:hypothetical protein